MHENPEQHLLWSDDSLLAVNKPPGLLTLPDGYDKTLPHLRSILEPRFGRLWIVHRLDRDTSGVIVLARTAAAHRHLNTQFQEHQASKLYHALVVGQPPWDTLIVDDRLLQDGDRRHRTIVDPERGKSAITELRVLRRLDGFSLLEAVLRTGRSHQIRAHLKHIGYPILADPLYGDPTHPCQTLISRLGLHALSLTLTHPKTEEIMTFEAPYPKDFANLIVSPTNE
jgi:tRNA pseudouridine32 synthase/23S rRNA pseudouridine746 synthase